MSWILFALLVIVTYWFAIRPIRNIASRNVPAAYFNENEPSIEDMMVKTDKTITQLGYPDLFGIEKDSDTYSIAPSNIFPPGSLASLKHSIKGLDVPKQMFINVRGQDLKDEEHFSDKLVIATGLPFIYPSMVESAREEGVIEGGPDTPALKLAESITMKDDGIIVFTAGGNIYHCDLNFNDDSTADFCVTFFEDHESYLMGGSQSSISGRMGFEEP